MLTSWEYSPVCMTFLNCPKARTSDVRPLKYFISCFGGSRDIFVSFPMLTDVVEKSLVERAARGVVLGRRETSLVVTVRENIGDEEEESNLSS